MIEKHKELLDAIRSAEKAALALLNSGEKIQKQFQALRTAGNEIEERIKYYERHTPAEMPAAKAKKPGKESARLENPKS